MRNVAPGPRPGHLWRTLWGYPLYLSLSLALGTLVFVPRVHAYFVSDDWPVLLRNMHVSWQEVPHWFAGMRFGWYRPLFDVFVSLCWRWFGLSPAAYRVTSIVLCSIVSANVGAVARLLTQDRLAGLAATVLCATSASHAEPVLWYAASNELLAGSLVSTGMVSYILFRRGRGRPWFVACLLCCFGALASKETSLAFPPILLVYDVLYPSRQERRSVRFLLPSLTLVVLGIVFALLRVPQDSAYSVHVTAPRLLLNLAYYAFVGVFALPSNYAVQASLPLWRTSPVLPVAALTVSCGALATAAWIGIRARAQEPLCSHKRALLFCTAWAVGAIVPVIPIVAERTVYLSSLGIAMGLGIAFVGAYRTLKADQRRARAIVAVAMVAYAAVSLSVLRYRSAVWGRAAEASEAILMDLRGRLPNLPPDCRVVALNIPDNIEYAYVFRNAFPAAAEVLEYDRAVEAWPDWELNVLGIETKSEAIGQLAQGPHTVAYWYDGGVLRLERDSCGRAVEQGGP